MECLIYKKKKVEKFEKKSKERKYKKAYIAWEDNDMESSGEPENEVTNFCLMARDSDSDSDEEVDISNLKPPPSYDELQNAIDGLHKESLRLTKVVVSSKKIILSLENEVSILNKELEELKIENKTLGLLDANSFYTKCLSHENASTSSCCSSCKSFENENDDLKKVLAKFTLGRNNPDILLGKQRCVFNKAGSGYNPKVQQSKSFASSSISSSPFITCFYCGKKGHSASTCYIRKNGHASGKMIWVPKSILPKSNNQGPKKIWVPKSKVGICDVGVPKGQELKLVS